MLMKRNWIILLGCLLWTINTHALIVSVEGEGEIDELMELTITEAEEDPLTGDNIMEIKGNLLTSNPLTVSITRSSTGLTDEFCCAGQCTFGNRETTEELHLSPNGMASWYIHYTPQADSNESIEYRFDDGQSVLVLRVEFNYEAQGMENVEDTKSKAKSKKILQNGIIYIIQDERVYYL